MKLLADNKHGLYHHHVLESYLAGIVLAGHEVKSIKAGQVNLKGSYATITKGEVFVYNMHIAPYAKASHLQDYSPTHPRKLLLKKREIEKLTGMLSHGSVALIPLSLEEKNRKIKMSLAVAKAKKSSDKKASIKEREISRDAARTAWEEYDL